MSPLRVVELEDGVELELQVEACVRPSVVPNTNEIIKVPDEAGEDSLPPLMVKYTAEVN